MERVWNNTRGSVKTTACQKGADSPTGGFRVGPLPSMAERSQGFQDHSCWGLHTILISDLKSEYLNNLCCPVRMSVSLTGPNICLSMPQNHC